METVNVQDTKTITDVRSLPTLDDYGDLKSNITNYQSQRQIRSVDTTTKQTDTFSRGLLSYEFQVAPNELACIKDSYLKSVVKATVLDGGVYRKPKAVDDFALSENFMVNLIQSCSFSVGNTIICSQNDYCGQVSMVNYRVTKDLNWLQSMRDVYFLDPSFESRQNSISSDGYLEITNYTNLLGYVGATTLTGGSSDPQTLTIGAPGVNGNWKVGDKISYASLPANGQVPIIVAIDGDVLTLDGDDTLYPDPGTATFTAQNPDRIREENDPRKIADRRNTLEILWKPPLSIFHQSAEGLLPQGQYKLKITAKGDKLAAMERSNTPGYTDLSLIVKSTVFVLKTYKTTSQIAKDGTFYLELPEWDIQDRQCNQGRGQTNLTFTVPVTTHMIALFVQDSGAGTLSNVPPSRFVSENDSQKDIRHLTVQFGGVTKPANIYRSEFTETTNNQVQRWYEHVRNIGHGETSSETYDSWLKRGNLYATSFVKEKGDNSTVAQVNIDFGDLKDDQEIFCCALYRRIVKFVLKDGWIVNVQSIQA